MLSRTDIFSCNIQISIQINTINYHVAYCVILERYTEKYRETYEYFQQKNIVKYKCNIKECHMEIYMVRSKENKTI